MKSVIVISIALISCVNSSDDSFYKNLDITHGQANLNISSVIDTTTETSPFPEDYQLLTTTYKTDTSRKDSLLMCTEYLFIDQTRNKEGQCYYRLPFQLEAMSTDFLERLKDEKSFETFDSMMCEVGGQSAYNKFKHTNLGGDLSEIIHYKAWYEDYDDEGNDITHDTPDYFIGERIKVTQTDAYLKMEAFDEENVTLECIENFYTEDGLLIRQVWRTYGTEVYIAHYVYTI